MERAAPLWSREKSTVPSFDIKGPAAVAEDGAGPAFSRSPRAPEDAAAGLLPTGFRADGLGFGAGGPRLRPLAEDLEARWREIRQPNGRSNERRCPSVGRVLRSVVSGCSCWRKDMTLRKLKSSPVITLLAVWHTYGVWVGACIIFTASANLLLAWYIQWFRGSQRTQETQCTEAGCIQKDFAEFQFGDFFAIFLRSWMLVSLVGEMARFCYLFALDAWRIDAFQAYRRAACGELWRELEAEVAAASASPHAPLDAQLVGGWPADILVSKRRWLDALLQVAIYLSLDVTPVTVGAFCYWQSGDMNHATVAVSASLAAASCVHVMLFFIAWNTTDVCLKVGAFRRALRSETRLRPVVYHGESLEDFHWAWSFGDRHLQNLQLARCSSFDVDGDGPPTGHVSSCGDAAVPASVCGAAGAGAGLGMGAGTSGSSSSVIVPEEKGKTWNTSGRVPLSARHHAPAPRPGEPIARSTSEGSEAEGAQAHVGLQELEWRKAEYKRRQRPEGWNSEEQLDPAAAVGSAALAPSSGAVGAPSANCEGSETAAEEQLNLCVPVCGWLAGAQAVLLPHICWAAFLAVGIVVDNAGLKLIGGVLAILCLLRLFGPGKDWQCEWRCPLFWGGGSWRLWSLQAWGETYCSLIYEVQSSARVTFSVMVLLQGIIFAVIWNRPGMMICVVTLICILLRQLVMYMERPWGWLTGILEGLAVGMGTVVLNWIWRPPDSTNQWALVTLTFSLARQFGLARHNPRGFRIARFTSLIMSGMMVLVVGVATLAQDMKPSTGEASSSYFCGGDLKKCTYHQVPYKAPTQTYGLLCQGRFSLGDAKLPGLSLTDFGLFSSLAYEPEATIEFALQHYFPGWRRTYSRRAGVGKNKTAISNDWTTFFEFTDPSNETTIFAIQGTNSALDILDDINIWTPAAIMQGFSAAGPGVSNSVAQAIALLSTVLYGEAVQKRYFSALLKHVIGRQKQWPNRRMYLTGHSLGGGLAKLVASQTSIQAVTFMAPGLATTGFVVFGQDVTPQLRNTSLTVMPENDIVSRVDNQRGVVIRVDCSGNPLTCHKIYNTLCFMYDKCGSGRELGYKLTLPCGVCPGYPCEEKDQAESAELVGGFLA